MRPTGTRVRVGRGDSAVRSLPARPTSLLSLGVEQRARRGTPWRSCSWRPAPTPLWSCTAVSSPRSGTATTTSRRARRCLMSITKSFVGCLTGILAARGVVDVDAPVVQYAPELAAGGYAPARVRDVLDMRTGGDYVEDHDDPGGEVAEIARALVHRGRDGPHAAGPDGRHGTSGDQGRAVQLPLPGHRGARPGAGARLRAVAAGPPARRAAGQARPRARRRDQRRREMAAAHAGGGLEHDRARPGAVRPDAARRWLRG